MGKKALVIGAGGVSNVVCHKCAQNSEVFSSIMIASRRKVKCDEIRERIEKASMLEELRFRLHRLMLIMCLNWWH